MFATLLIIAITCIVSFAAFGNSRLVDALILWPPAIRRGDQYYRLVSYGLIHANFQHLLFNMLTLFFFGAVMEGFFTRYIGHMGFALFYIAGLVVSILPTYLANRNNPRYRSLGASGAISAVLFAFILLRPWATIYVFVLPVPAIVYAVVYVGYSIYMDRQSADSVNHSAHLWGAAYGIVFTVLMEPRVLGAFLGQLAQPRFGL